MHDYSDPILYNRWIIAFDTLDYQQRAEKLIALSAIEDPPVFSFVILPVPGLDPDRTLRSLLAQLYPHLEIWIAEQDLPS